MRIQEIIDVARSVIWRMEHRDEFPSRIPLGASGIGWFKSGIDAWLKTKIHKGDTGENHHVL